MTTSFVKISTRTPMLAVSAMSWMTGMSMTIMTAKPTTFVSSAVRPVMNRRRKV